MNPSASEGDIRKAPGRSMSLAPKLSQTPCQQNGYPQRTNDNRVIINVGGVRYETFRSTLKNIPDTRLSWITETTSQNADYDPSCGEYFFDRHPGVFNMVINYYRTGKLHAPIDVCGPLFEEELAFWGIDEKQIEACCWMTYRTHRDAQETLAELDGDNEESDTDSLDNEVALRFGIEETAGPQRSKLTSFRHKMWTLLEEPYSSQAAQVIAITSLAFVILSIATFVLETNLTFRVARNESDPKSTNWSTYEKNIKSRPHDALIVLEIVCITFFTSEYLTRLFFCPVKKRFFKSILNWVDLCSIIPFYLEKIVVLVNSSLEYSVLLQVLKAIRLIRIFRIFKLTRHFSGLKILGHTVKASARELLLLIMFLIISVLIFACIIYYAESVDEAEINDFKDIPIGFWWSLVTMTTLGYGDMYPRTGLGYIVGSLCAVSGVLVLALPVPVIVNNFALYYSHSVAKSKLPKKRKTALVGAPDLLKTQQTLPGASLSEFVSSPSPSHTPQHHILDESTASIDSGCDRTTGRQSTSAGSTQTGISVLYIDDTGSDNISLRSYDETSIETDKIPKSVSEPIAIKKATGKEDYKDCLKRRNSFGLGHTPTNLKPPVPSALCRRNSVHPTPNVSLPDVVE